MEWVISGILKARPDEHCQRVWIEKKGGSKRELIAGVDDRQRQTATNLALSRKGCKYDT